MKRTWTIIGVARRAPELRVVPVATWPAGDRSCPRRLRANRRLGWNDLALSPRVGCSRASLQILSTASPATASCCSSGSTTLT